jgi:polyferredoxin
MRFRTLLVFLFVIGIVVGLSMASNQLWQDKSESSEVKPGASVTITEQMTVREVATAYSLSPKALKGPFGLASPSDLDKTLAGLGLSVVDAQQRLQGIKALATEESSKNWFKIPLKFVLWIAFLIIVFRLMRRGQITPHLRKILLITAVGVFGIILGSDPSPMGTVKDTIVLFGKDHVIFPPRLVAFTVFSLMVIFANKFICSWGCQLGVLQDLIYRINRNSTDTAGLIRQWKLPFALTNTIRITFLAAICIFAVAWAADIVSPIDPFRIYSPAKLGLLGSAFAGLLLITSLFIYRPWCHLFCPFGLTGWIFEKLSVYKIKVNYDTCIACEACAKACPSTVMGAILKQDKVIPDCFSCGTCQGVCPTKSITFAKGARTKPPTGKFAGK